jgi:hypothetical protein
MSSPPERLSFLPDFPGRRSLYHPLNASKDEIRVVIVASSEDRSSTIHCGLQTISIQNGRSTLPYDAISYFWGSTSTTEEVHVFPVFPTVADRACCVGVPVTRALAGALRQFRARATRLKRPLILWTDAICIHQLDAAERSQQVNIMRRVYESAESVLVWLGESDPVAEMGLVNLFGVAMCRQANDLNLGSSKDSSAAFDYQDFDAEPDLDTLKRVNEILEKSACEPRGSEIKCKHIKDMCKDMKSWIQTVSALVDLSYWYRGWTIQEASANSRISLHYGRTRCRVVYWRALELIMFDKTCTLSGVVGEGGARTFFHFGRWIRIMSEVQRAEQYGTRVIEEDPIPTLVSSIGHTADPRDRVYSLIGYAPTFKRLQIKPDYTLTTEQRHHRDAHILLGACYVDGKRFASRSKINDTNSL